MMEAGAALRSMNACDLSQLLTCEPLRMRGLHVLQYFNHTMSRANGRIQLIAQVHRLPVCSELMHNGIFSIRWVSSISQTENG